MKKLQHLFIITLSLLLFASCATQNKVMTNNFIQKRKYTKGFFIGTKKQNAQRTQSTSQKFEIANIASEKIEATPIDNSIERDLLTITHQPSPVRTDNDLSTKTEVGQAKQKPPVQFDIEVPQSVLNTHAPKMNNNGLLKAPRPLVPNSPLNGGSQVVALALCFFIGIFGIHRMYLGYIGIGLLQLITFGGLGIWWFIDLIRIIIGDLKPKSGRYIRGF